MSELTDTILELTGRLDDVEKKYVKTLERLSLAMEALQKILDRTPNGSIIDCEIAKEALERIKE